MSPFNLDKALHGEPLVTRKNKPVKVFGETSYTDEKKYMFILEGEWEPRYCRKDGTYDTKESNYDLFLK